MSTALLRIRNSPTPCSAIVTPRLSRFPGGEADSETFASARELKHGGERRPFGLPSSLPHSDFGPLQRGVLGDLGITIHHETCCSHLEIDVRRWGDPKLS